MIGRTITGKNIPVIVSTTSKLYFATDNNEEPWVEEDQDSDDDELNESILDEIENESSKPQTAETIARINNLKKLLKGDITMKDVPQIPTYDKEEQIWKKGGLPETQKPETQKPEVEKPEVEKPEGKTETPTEYVERLSETEMPSYTDSDD